VVQDIEMCFARYNTTMSIVSQAEFRNQEFRGSCIPLNNDNVTSTLQYRKDTRLGRVSETLYLSRDRDISLVQFKRLLKTLWFL